MTQAPPLLMPPKLQQPGIRRQWALRLLAGMVVGLAVAYVALPWWMPADLLRRRLEADLTRQLGSPVRIGRLQASWVSGFSLHDLTIAEDRPGRTGQVVHLGQIRCEMAPLKFLIGMKVRELEILDPHIWLEIDSDGKIHIGDLGSGEPGALPSLNYAVHGLTIHVATPQVAQTFRIDRLDLQLDPETGLLDLGSVTRVNRSTSHSGEPRQGRLDFDANVRVPRLKKTEELSGTIRIEWADLAMNDLPVPIISRVPVEQVDGTSNGRLILDTHPDLGLDFSLSVVLNGVSIMRPELPRPTQVPDADFSCSGHWDPTQNSLVIKTLRYETPGLKIEPVDTQLAVLHFDERGPTPLELHLKGRVKSWDDLQREFPELDRFTAAAQCDPAGQTSFAMEYVRTAAREDRLRVELDATDSVWNVGPEDDKYFIVEQGVPKTCRFELAHNRRTNRLSTRNFSLSLGDLAVDIIGEYDPITTAAAVGNPANLHATLPLPAKELFDQLLTLLSHTRAEVAIRATDADHVRRLFPGLNRGPSVPQLTGPVQWAFSIEPKSSQHSTSSRIHLAALLPPESSLIYADFLNKPAGRALQLRVDAEVPLAEAGRLSLLSADLQYGPGRAVLTTGKTGFEYQLEFDKQADQTNATPTLEHVRGKASWAFDLNLTSLQDLLPLSPRLQQLQAEQQITQAFGDCALDCRAQLTLGDQSTVVTSQARLLADDLELLWSSNVNKLAGSALDIDLRHNWKRLPDQQEHQFSIDIRRQAGKISGIVSIPSPSAIAQDAPIQITASVNVSDMHDWFQLCPRLIHELGPHLPIGEINATARAQLHNDKASGRLTLDATQAGLGGGNSTRWHKPIGLPATTDITWHAETTGTTGLQHWVIDQAHLQLGESTVDRLSADVAFATQQDSSPNLPAIIKTLRTHVTANGKLMVSDDLKSIHPQISRLIDELELDGAASWQLNTRITPALLSIDGRLDATEATLTLRPLGEDTHRIVKPIGDLVAGSCSLAIESWLSPGEQTLIVNNIKLDVLDASATAQGRVSLPDPSASPDLRFSLRVPRLEKLLHLLPNPPIQTLRGGIDLDAELQCRDGSPGISHGELSLDNLQVGSAQRPLILRGKASLESDVYMLDLLEWQWGQSAGAFSGMLTPHDRGHSLQLSLFSEYIHVEDMLACIADFKTGLPTARPDRDAVAEPAPGADLRAQARPILDLLRRSHANIETHVGTVVTPLPLGIKAVLDAAWKQLTLDQGKLALTFACLVDGGQVNGDVVMDLNVPEPAYRLTYTAEKIQAGNVTRAYLRRTFPGMEASGPLTLIDESNAKLLPAPDEPNFELGKGEIIIDGGVITGRAAPLWVTKIFPGLNLASFEFTRMHSWFDKTATGRTTHQMIYQGAYYHVYMIGWSDPDGTFRYEVGVDFLAGLESEYWANTGQGRVPLFTKTGQVMPDGSLHDETVTFVSLQRVLETLFVKNNPLITAYYGVMKQVKDKK